MKMRAKPAPRVAAGDRALAASRPRPTMTPRRQPDLTSFLLGFVVLVAVLFLVTAAGAHVRERTAATIAQGEAWQIAHGIPTPSTR